MHQVVVGLAAPCQAPTPHCGDVRGGRKPYRRRRRTGRACQGSTRALQFVGGTVHGPQPRDYTQRTPRR